MKKKNKRVAPRKPRSAADKLSTAICVVIILAVLGLSAWALYSPIKSKLTAKNTTATDTTDAAQTQEEQEPTTAQTVADQLGISFDEMVAEYGVDATELTAESTVEELLDKMSAENFYKLNKTMFEQSAPADDATDEEKQQYTDSAATFESFDAFVTAMGVDPSEITDGMTASAFQMLVSQKQQEAAAANEEGSEEATEETTEDAPVEQADDSAPEAQLAD